MTVTIVMWNLRESDQTIESLRDYLRGYAVDAYSSLDGMHLKAWFGNTKHDTWGAVYVWDSTANISDLFTVSRAVELIGYQPSWVGHFTLEATAMGNSAHKSLSGLGAAFDAQP